eukprot:TRINITY_DN921_c2_g1_i3.p1 TRINITY_DN921_c2_g1~~TRINITY_DN921_c2_g1_i3.p1  ORF type:complete len:325 (+),score=74.82 TRINITY_DN921_c2_g1_i3:409-1383(+)
MVIPYLMYHYPIQTRRHHHHHHHRYIRLHRLQNYLEEKNCSFGYIISSKKIFGRGANANFCVSEMMQKDLKDNWGINATVLYDRPPEFFKPATLNNKHKLFNKYPFGRKTLSSNSTTAAAAATTETAFTKVDNNKNVSLVRDRPVLIVSSTSWTKDENFDLLLDALTLLDKQQNLPPIRVVVTGKGDMKSHYQQIIDKKNLKNIKIYTEFLPFEDYATLIGSADIGVCLHQSSSGVDLPMKVVDMYGCGLPVCAIDYPAISELVEKDKTGLIFKDSKELCKQLKYLIEGHPESRRLQEMRENIKKYQNVGWTSLWEKKALKTFK